MTDHEKKIPVLLRNPEYLKKIFNERVIDIDPDGEKVLGIESFYPKNHADANFFHIVAYNKIRIRTKAGLRCRYRVLAIAFSGHGRKKMYQVLSLAYKHGFSEGEIIVPRPLWYLDELMAACYVGVPGENLLEHIKNGHTHVKLIELIARGLRRLHALKPGMLIRLSKHEFSLSYLDPTNVIEADHNLRTDLRQGVLEQYQLLCQKQNELGKQVQHLSHGDFHPENIIINQFNSNEAAIIDFSESCKAPIYYDIASFLEQLEFMTLDYISPEVYQKLEDSFLNAYFQGQEITRASHNQINLYKAWTALKSTVYFMIFTDEKNKYFAEYLLKKSKEYLGRIKNK